MLNCSASLAIQQTFSKPFLVNMIFKDTHLVFYIYYVTLNYYFRRMKKRSRVNDRTEKLVEVQDESPNIGNNVSLYNNNIIDW